MTRIESSFRELVDLATTTTPLEEHFYQEIDLMVRISGMINALPEKERENGSPIFWDPWSQPLRLRR